jgi:hypothetical protein
LKTLGAGREATARAESLASREPERSEGARPTVEPVAASGRPVAAAGLAEKQNGRFSGGGRQATEQAKAT